MVSVKGFAKVIVMAKGEAAFDVYSYPSPDVSTVFTAAKETLLTGITANNGDVKEVAKVAPYLYVTVKNTSAATAKYDLWIYGV
jgi:hypothetical protein